MLLKLFSLAGLLRHLYALVLYASCSIGFWGFFFSDLTFNWW